MGTKINILVIDKNKEKINTFLFAIIVYFCYFNLIIMAVVDVVFQTHMCIIFTLAVTF